MYRQTLEILRCPVCGGGAPLTIPAIFSEETDGEILDGVLSCGGCARAFRIQDGIADLVRDALREVEDERAFADRHGDAAAAFRSAIPTTGSNATDRRIVEEGRHWGAFMRRFWDVGDRSIFDLRIPATHPSLYVKGVLEPDDRDRDRPFGFFPTATGRLLFDSMDFWEGVSALDIGCGGGQFGLEAANRGVTVYSFDPSFEEVRLGRLHARESGAGNIEYFRAEPANPPFAPGAFDVLLAKDSLHHVPDLDAVFVKLLGLLREKGTIIVHEHVSDSRWKKRIMGAVAGRLLAKALRRYPRVEVPEELLRDSANEDVSAHAISPLLKKHFKPLAYRHDLFLAEELEMLAHYAFGKRRWFSKLLYWSVYPLERLLVKAGERQHLSFVGRRR